MNKRLALKVTLSLVFILYPALIYFSVQSVSTTGISVALLILTSIRLLVDKSKINVVFLAAALVVFIFSLISQTDIALKFYPVMVSLVLLGYFSFSLHYPPTVVERLARLHEPDLDEHGVVYTRYVTKAWCVFFFINGTVATITVFQSSEIWALYNGLISYLLIGLFFLIEFVVRYFYRKCA